MSTHLDVHGLSVVYVQSNGQRGFRECSFRAQGGEIMAILGESGSGKSSLLNCLAGYYWPRARTKDRWRSLLPMREKRLGSYDGSFSIMSENAHDVCGVHYVPQHLSLFEHGSIWDNIAVALNRKREGDVRGQEAALRGREDQWKKDAEELLRLFRVHADLAKEVRLLSGGEKQRVCLVRAFLVRERCLLMLDEPFEGIDYATRKIVERHLTEYVRETSSVCLVVSHDIHELAPIADRLLVFHRLPDGLFSAGETEFDDILNTDRIEDLQVVYGGNMLVVGYTNDSAGIRYLCVVPRGIQVCRDCTGERRPDGVVVGVVEKVNPVAPELWVRVAHGSLAKRVMDSRTGPPARYAVREDRFWVAVEDVDMFGTGDWVRLAVPEKAVVEAS